MNIAHLRPVVPGLFLYEAPDRGRFPYCHSFVIRGDTEVIIDPGCGAVRLGELTKVWKPDLAVVSHTHADHCSGLWMLEGTKVMSPVQHADIFWRFEPMGNRFARPGELAAMWIDFVKMTTGIREVEAGEHYQDGQLLDFGAIKLECMHAPGHTDDHYVFFEPRHGIAMIFDIDLATFGPWYGNRESDIDAFLTSIRRIAERRPRMIISSHKGVFTDDITGRLERYAGVVDERDAAILSLLDVPRTLAELVDKAPIYGKPAHTGKLMRHFESTMIDKHLERLHRKGILSTDGDRWRRL